MTICVSVAEASLEGALQAVLSAKERGAELAEVRFDRMPKLPENLSTLKSGPFAHYSNAAKQKAWGPVGRP